MSIYKLSLGKRNSQTRILFYKFCWYFWIIFIIESYIVGAGWPSIFSRDWKKKHEGNWSCTPEAERLMHVQQSIVRKGVSCNVYKENDKRSKHHSKKYMYLTSKLNSSEKIFWCKECLGERMCLERSFTLVLGWAVLLIREFNLKRLYIILFNSI